MERLQYWCSNLHTWQINRSIKNWRGPVTQAVSRLPPITGVPSLHLSHSMWVSYCTKQGLGRVFPISPTTNFISPFLHLISSTLVSFNLISSAPIMVRQAWSADILAIHWGLIASHSSTLPCVGHDLRLYYIKNWMNYNEILYHVPIQTVPIELLLWSAYCRFNILLE